MSNLEDATLIQKFVQGEVTLLANPSLRVETVFNAVQLIAKKEGLIARIRLEENRRVVLAKQSTSYWQLVHQALQDSFFMPIASPDQQGFVTYEQRPVPAGYQMHSTEAKLLWRAWWTSVRQSHRHTVQLDLLIFTRNNWYAIQDIICNQGTIFIKTWVGEIALQISDQVTWLNKVAQPLNSANGPQSGMTPLGSKTAVNHHLAAARTSQSQPSPSSQATPTNAGLRNPNQERSPQPLPDLSTVLKVYQDRLYIKTALGEILVEGSNLKVRLHKTAP